MVARQRILETIGMLMIGDGVLGVVEPEKHCRLWQRGPDMWQRMIEPFVHHPGWTRVFGTVEVGLGMWLASRQRPEMELPARGRLRELIGR